MPLIIKKAKESDLDFDDLKTVPRETKKSSNTANEKIK